MAPDAAHAPDQLPKARIFISYSRKDRAFADRLETALKARGFETLIDRTEIYAFEDWWQRIQALISRADTIVFVLSPDAVNSDVALKEVAHAEALNKRFAPIVYRRVEDTTVPGPLRRLNFIFFDDPDRFEVSANELADALITDINWIRRHTEYGEAACRWSAGGRARGLLLRPPVLDEAEVWIASRPPTAPEPTEDTRAFIRESRRGTTRRRNILMGGLSAGLVVAISLAALAYWQRGIAVINETRATEQRDEALLTQSRFLADVANQRVEADDAGTAALLALDALPDPDGGTERPYAPEPEAALFTALPRIREQGFLSVPGIAAFSAVFSPDGRTILAGFADAKARIYDTQSAKVILTLVGHSAGVISARFSPDGSRIVTASRDKTARIWDAKTGQVLITLSGHTAELWSAAFSPDGRRVVTASNDGTARIWDAQTGKMLTVINVAKAGDEAISTAEFSPDGRRIVTASGDARIWDSDTGGLLAVLSENSHSIASAAFNPDGTRVVTALGAGGDHTARVWDVASAKVIAVLTGHTDNLRHAVYSSDGRRILTASYDKTARVWDAQTAQSIATLQGNTDFVWDASFSQDGKYVITVSGDKTIRGWIVDLRTPAGLLQGGGMVLDAQFEPGMRAVTVSDDGTVRFWDTANLSMLRQIYVGSVLCATISPDGQKLATAFGNDAQIWDVQSGRSVMRLTGHLDTIWRMAFSPDGKRLVTASHDKTARIWDTNTGQLLVTLSGHTGTLESAAFSSDGRRVVTASADGTARIWDAQTGESLRTLKWQSSSGIGNAMLGAAFSPDGRRVLTVSNDHLARIWDVETGAITTVLAGHVEWVWAGQFSPDGQRVVTASRDRTARVWDISTGKTIALLDGNTKDVWTASFSPDGQQVITGSLDGTARLWHLYPSTKALVDAAKVAQQRCLSPSQREQFFLTAEPPAWCIELNKWPYASAAWKDWLRYRRENLSPPMPDSPQWPAWIANQEGHNGTSKALAK